VTTLGDAFAAGATAHRSTTVRFSTSGHVVAVTVGRLHDQATALADRLLAGGLRPGDTLAIQLPSCPEGVAAFLAGARLGLRILPIVPIYGPHELKYILEHGDARMLIAADRWRGKDVLERLDVVDTSRCQVVVVGDAVPDGVAAWTDLVAGGADRHVGALPVVEPGDVAMLMYTSGTSSQPKGVLHTHASLLAELTPWRPVLDLRGTFLKPQPAGHIAQVVTVGRAVLHGVDTIFMDHYDAEVAAGLIDEYAVEAMSATPHMLTTLLDRFEAGHGNGRSVRLVRTGGAAVPPALIERADAFGWRAWREYGSTEHPTISAGRPDDPLDKRARTDGRLEPGNQVRILDERGADVAPGDDGEIVSRGPDRFLRYQDDAHNREAFTADGWFRTGDIGHVNADGYLCVTDRKKDIIIRGGENISASEVEAILCAHPDIVEAAVTGVPDERMGERACAFVVLRPGAQLTMPELMAHFASVGAAKQKVPEQLELRHALPRTPGGKVQKAELRASLGLGPDGQA